MQKQNYPEEEKENKTNCIIKNFGNISWKFWFVFGTAKVSTSNHFPDDMRSKQIQQHKYIVI